MTLNFCLSGSLSPVPLLSITAKRVPSVGGERVWVCVPLTSRCRWQTCPRALRGTSRTLTRTPEAPAPQGSGLPGQGPGGPPVVLLPPFCPFFLCSGRGLQGALGSVTHSRAWHPGLLASSVPEGRHPGGGSLACTAAPCPLLKIRSPGLTSEGLITLFSGPCRSLDMWQ